MKRVIAFIMLKVAEVLGAWIMIVCLYNIGGEALSLLDNPEYITTNHFGIFLVGVTLLIEICLLAFLLFHAIKWFFQSNWERAGRIK